MKKFIPLVVGALWMAATQVGAAILAGPITNPANGHDYYLLSSDSWTASEAAAERLGGTLAIIKNAGEQEWVFSNFAKYGNTNRNLWIGLCRYGPNRSLIWMTGWKGEYVNWAGGQPDDAGRVEGCVFMSATRPWGFAVGHWSDMANEASIDGLVPNGVVEVPGKSREKTLGAAEKALRGNWYLAGKADSECHVASTENALFVINEGNWAGRVILMPEGRLFVAPHLFGEIVKDKILWNNGSWWSRQPEHFESGSEEEATKVEGLEHAAGK
jgi:hypothetical protein